METTTINTPHNTVTFIPLAGTVSAKEFHQEIQGEQPKPTPTDLGHDKLLSCLYFIFDAFERCGLQFFLVRDTAKKAMTEYMLEGDHIDIGIRRLEWNNDQKDILFVYLAEEGVEKTEDLPDRMTYKWQDIPFTIHFYEDNPCVTALVPIVYEHEHFLIPNQFAEFESKYDTN